MNSKVKAAALDFVKSQVRPGHNLEGQALHDVYEAECRLFDVHFKKMSKSEIAEYTKFVTWLDNSDMWKSDLTIDELYDIHTNIEHDHLMEIHDDLSMEDFDDFSW